MSEESYKDSDENEEIPAEAEELDVLGDELDDELTDDIEDLDDDDLEDEIELVEDASEEVISMLQRMQQQLTFLEKKIDLLLNAQHGRQQGGHGQGGHGRREGGERFERHEGGERSFERRPPARPFQKKSYDRPRRFDRDDRPRHAWDEDGAERGEQRPSFRDREASREHYFERRGPAGPRKPGGKPKFGKPAGKKPFYSRYKD